MVLPPELEDILVRTPDTPHGAVRFAGTRVRVPAVRLPAERRDFLDDFAPVTREQAMAVMAWERRRVRGAPPGPPSVREGGLKIILDDSVPRRLRHRLAGHETSTAEREGWAAPSNGRSLTAAEAAGFELLATRDRGFLHQRNLAGRRIGVDSMLGSGQDTETLTRLVDELARRIDETGPGRIVSIKIDRSSLGSRAVTNHPAAPGASVI